MQRLGSLKDRVIMWINHKSCLKISNQAELEAPIISRMKEVQLGGKGTFKERKVLYLQWTAEPQLIDKLFRTISQKHIKKVRMSTTFCSRENTMKFSGMWLVRERESKVWPTLHWVVRSISLEISRRVLSMQPPPRVLQVRWRISFPIPISPIMMPLTQ